MTTSKNLPYAVRRISPSEHQLVAARNLAAGELILCERPIVHVPVGYYRLTTYVWDMVEALMADKLLFQQFTRCQLLATPLFTDEQDLEIEKHLVQKYKKSRQFVRNLYFGVATNNVGILDQDYLVQGHGVFPLLSRSDHSCVPNSALTPANWREQEVSLVAKRDISAGEALTWCYFREAEFLPADWTTRNYNLVNLYRFACRCPRCKAERPPEVPVSSAGQVAYLDKLIAEAARELAQAPDGMEQLRAQCPVNVHRERLFASRNR